MTELTDNYMTVAQAAVTLEMTQGGVRKLIESGRLIAEKTGPHRRSPYMVRRDSVEKYAATPKRQWTTDSQGREVTTIRVNLILSRAEFDYVTTRVNEEHVSFSEVATELISSEIMQRDGGNHA